MVSVQAKIVGDFCNLRCTYCRDRDYAQGKKEVMSLLILERLIASLAKVPGDKQRMHWLGGEPTLAGIEFFENVVRLQKGYPHKKWLNTIQTNATGINKRWAKFFAENKFHVGVSIDGTERIHDADRIGVKGKGSYAKAMQGVKTLNAQGVHPSVISVVTRQNASAGAEMLRGLVGAGFTKIAFNAFYNTATSSGFDECAVSDALWTKFLADVFEEWLRLNRPDVQVREIDEMIAWTQGRRVNSCTFTGLCSQWVLVDHDGKMYPCERLGRATSFGIVSPESFAGLADNASHQAFACGVSSIPDVCKTCPMQKFCHNGCVAHRVDDGNTEKHYAYCHSRLTFFDYVKKRIGGVPFSEVTQPASVPAVPLVFRIYASKEM